MTLERQTNDEAHNSGGVGGQTVGTYRVLDAFATLTRQAAKASESALWTAGKFLLSAGETANYAWDVTLTAALNLLRASSAAYDGLAAKIGHVAVLGFGASGVNEAVKAALDVAESNAKHDMAARKAAFATLHRRMDASGTRLSGNTATVVRPIDDAVVSFPRQ